MEWMFVTLLPQFIYWAHPSCLGSWGLMSWTHDSDGRIHALKRRKHHLKTFATQNDLTKTFVKQEMNCSQTLSTDNLIFFYFCPPELWEINISVEVTHSVAVVGHADYSDHYVLYTVLSIKTFWLVEGFSALILQRRASPQSIVHALRYTDCFWV